MMPGDAGYVVGNAGPFPLEAQPRSLAKRHQFLLAENDLDDRCAVGVFSQIGGSVIVEHRHAVENAVTRRDARRLADGGLIVDDVHQRHAIEDDVEGAVGVGQPGRVGHLEGRRRDSSCGRVRSWHRSSRCRCTRGRWKQGGEYLGIVTAAAADLEQARIGMPVAATASAAILKSQSRLAALHGGDQAFIGAFLPRDGARGEPSGG